MTAETFKARSLQLVRVTPIGKTKSGMFVMDDRGQCSFREVEVDQFPPVLKALELRQLRTRRGSYLLTLRAASELLGIDLVELSDLERGRVTCVDDAEWERVFDAIRAEVAPLRW